MIDSRRGHTHKTRTKVLKRPAEPHRVREDKVPRLGAARVEEDLLGLFDQAGEFGQQLVLGVG